jgi:hypothetical protein
MTQEFERIHVNAAKSAAGFFVQLEPMGGILYHDKDGETRVEFEWLGKPPRILIYLQSLEGIQASRRQEIITNVTRALEFLGPRVELWGPEGPI